MKSQSIPPKSSSSLPMKFFNSLYTITKPQKKLKATPNAVDLAMDLLLFSQTRKHRGESAYHQFKTTNLCQHHGHQKKSWRFHQKIAFLLKFIWCKRNDLTTNKLSIFLSVADFANHAKFVFVASVSCLLVCNCNKIQNHTAISNCCLARRQVGAKGAVIPPILNCKYSSVEQKLLWLRKTNYSIH